MPLGDNDDKNHGTFRRLSAVEADIGLLKSDVGYIRAQVMHLGESLEALIRDLSKAQAPNWGVLAAWAAVILSLMVFYTSLSNQPRDEKVNELKAAWERHRGAEATLAELQAQMQASNKLIAAQHELFEQKLELIRQKKRLMIKELDNRLTQRIDLEVKIRDEKLKYLETRLNQKGQQ